LPAPDLLDDRPNVIGRQVIATHDEVHDGLGHDLVQG
jgi:hypothetical protein